MDSTQILTVTDASGNPVNCTTGQIARDDDSFQNQDARLIDLLLPADGTYYIKVDFTFPDLPDDLTTYPDNETGNYELFVYGFHSGRRRQRSRRSRRIRCSAAWEATTRWSAVRARQSSSRSRATRTGSMPSTGNTTRCPWRTCRARSGRRNVGDTVGPPGVHTPDPDNTSVATALSWTVIDSTGQPVATGLNQTFRFRPGQARLASTSRPSRSRTGRWGRRPGPRHGSRSVSPEQDDRDLGRLDGHRGITLPAQSRHGGNRDQMQSTTHGPSTGATATSPNSWAIPATSCTTAYAGPAPAAQTITASALIGSDTYPAEANVTVSIVRTSPRAAVFSSTARVQEGDRRPT